MTTTKRFKEKFIITQNRLLLFKLHDFFQNTNVHCHITEDTISLTHRWKCPAGVMVLTFLGTQDHCDENIYFSMQNQV